MRLPVVFAATMLMPSVRDTGPDGGKVMLALLRRGYMTILPVAALLTIVSGFWMYMKLMSTVGPAWAGSMPISSQTSSSTRRFSAPSQMSPQGWSTMRPVRVPQVGPLSTGQKYLGLFGRFRTADAVLRLLQTQGQG